MKFEPIVDMRSKLAHAQVLLNVVKGLSPILEPTIKEVIDTISNANSDLDFIESKVLIDFANSVQNGNTPPVFEFYVGGINRKLFFHVEDEK